MLKVQKAFIMKGRGNASGMHSGEINEPIRPWKVSMFVGLSD